MRYLEMYVLDTIELEEGTRVMHCVIDEHLDAQSGHAPGILYEMG